MKQSSSCSDPLAKKKDERFSLGLLREYLKQRFGSESTCDVNCNDPPDLIATLPNRECWGVEVTRAYQQVKLPGKDKIASSEALFFNLKHWADAIGEKTVGIRSVGYSLFLGPGSLSLRDDPPPLFDQKWKEDSERAIYGHIESGNTNILRRPGLWFKPGEPGQRWTVGISPGGSAPISSVTASMLSRTLLSKARMVPNWNGTFDQEWLLVLNFYPLANDISDVKAIVERLVRSKQELLKFNGVLWYDRLRSNLVAIPIPGSSLSK